MEDVERFKAEAKALQQVEKATPKSLGKADPDVIDMDEATRHAQAIRTGMEARARKLQREAEAKGLAPKAPGGKSGYYSAFAKREEWLKHFRESLDVKDACQKVGISYSGYRMWRQTYPEFRNRVEAVRAAEISDTKVGWSQGFGTFRKRYLKMDSPWFHLAVVEALEKGEKGSITLILMPPEHGKTTLLEDFCTYKLAIEPTFRILVASGRREQATKVLRRVRNRFEDGFVGPFPELVARFGPFAPQQGGDRESHQPWADTHFDVFKKGTHDERDYSMAALGIDTSVQGARCDLLVLDDVQGLKTLSQTDKIIDAIQQDWLSRPGVTGHTVVIGTRVGEKDVYERLMEEGLVDNLIMFPAHDHHGAWLWPEKYSPEDYARLRRNASESGWWRNYMQRPRAGKGGAFDEKTIDAASNPMRRTDHPPPQETLGIVEGLDPGFGTTALVWAAMLPDKLIVLGGAVHHDLTNNEQIAQVCEEPCHLYRGSGMDMRRVTDLRIEDKAFQKGLLDDPAINALVKEHGLNVDGHQTGINKYDANIGIPSMARSFRIGEIELPAAADDATQVFYEDMKGQLVSWRPYKQGTRLVQDLVMALWFCWLRWLEVRENAKASTDMFKSRGMGRPPMKVLVGGKVR